MHSAMSCLCGGCQQLLLLVSYAHTQSQLLLSASLQLLLLLLSERRWKSRTALQLPSFCCCYAGQGLEVILGLLR